MNNTKNKNISALVINADGLVYELADAQNSLMHSKLAKTIDDLLYHGFKVIWISNSADAKDAIKAILGNLHEKTSIIGYERLIHPTLDKISIAPDEAILISNHKSKSDDMSVKKKLHARLIADSPEELIRWLQIIRCHHLLVDPFEL